MIKLLQSFRSYATARNNCRRTATATPFSPVWQPSAFCFSTATATMAAVDARVVASRLAVGSHKWATMDRKVYQDIVHTAIANGITTLEVGQEGGDILMSEVLSTIASEEAAESSTTAPPRIELIQRVGYRILTKNKHGMMGDVQVEETATGTVQHNITAAALQSALYDSYLLHAPSAQWKTTRTLLLHNPEVQITNDDMPLTQRQEHLRQVLMDSFLYLQEACLQQQEQQHQQQADVKPHNMRGYGIVSNGLGLPNKHPLHLSWTDAILPALQDVHSQLGMGDNDRPLDFKVVQLPVNLLETTGLQVAQQVDSDRKALDILSERDLQIIAMRPLTCYPDRGTGDGKPFILADYQLPATMDKTLQWTQHMQQPPAAYQVALKTAMAHFDATELLDLKEEGIDLSTEQRETLDGCKLMQSLLHDVDASLESVRSFAQHEQDLFQRIIPLIHDTFEGYDEDTAQILQTFFGAYSLAVRYAIAKNTRQVLVEGDKDGSAPKYPDLSPDVALQEYALHFLLQAKCIDKFLVGFSEPEQILQDMDIVHKYYLNQDNPGNSSS